MRSYLEKLELRFYTELEALLSTRKNDVHSALELSQRYLIDLKNEIIDRGFKKPEDEISCFKLTKPKLQAEVIYFRGILMTQQNLPIGPNEIKVNYLNNHLARFHLFFEENQELIRYCRSELTFLDTHFFIRQNAQAHRTYEMDFSEVDFRWSTGYDIILAKCLAFEKLEYQIKHELFRIQHLEETQFNPTITQSNPKKQLQWTESEGAVSKLHLYGNLALKILKNGQKSE